MSVSYSAFSIVVYENCAHLNNALNGLRTRQQCAGPLIIILAGSFSKRATCDKMLKLLYRFYINMLLCYSISYERNFLELFKFPGYSISSDRLEINRNTHNAIALYPLLVRCS